MPTCPKRAKLRRRPARRNPTVRLAGARRAGRARVLTGDDDPGLAGFVWCDTADRPAALRLMAELSRMNLARVAIENAHAVSGKGGGAGVTFAVTMNAAREFAPLGAFLCQAGCRLSVLPAAADDRRISLCR